jgi:hypothetical protein
VNTPPPDAPPPDDKDWTWVLQAPCPDCGFDASLVDRGAIASRTTHYAGQLGAALERPGADRRPAPDTWSPVEYACHVRDVCEVFAERLQLMLTEDDPSFANWDQDATAIEKRYWAQRPAQVATELARSAAPIAAAFAAVGEDQWDRPGRRSNGSVFTVDTLARYFLHDLAHHVWDVSGTRSG